MTGSRSELRPARFDEDRCESIRRDRGAFSFFTAVERDFFRLAWSSELSLSSSELLRAALPLLFPLLARFAGCSSFGDGGGRLRAFNVLVKGEGGGGRTVVVTVFFVTMIELMRVVVIVGGDDWEELARGRGGARVAVVVVVVREGGRGRVASATVRAVVGAGPLDFAGGRRELLPNISLEEEGEERGGGRGWDGKRVGLRERGERGGGDARVLEYAGDEEAGQELREGTREAAEQTLAPASTSNHVEMARTLSCPLSGYSHAHR